MLGWGSPHKERVNREQLEQGSGRQSKHNRDLAQPGPQALLLHSDRPRGTTGSPRLAWTGTGLDGSGPPWL